MQLLKHSILVLLSLTTFVQIGFADAVTDLISSKTKNEITSKKVITTHSSVTDDEKIRIRLEKIFAELEELKGITLNVSNGVVELNGSTISDVFRDKAVQLASQVEGVVEVENSISVNLKLETRMKKTLQQLQDIGRQIFTGLPIFLIALIVFILFWLLGRWVSTRQVIHGHLTSNKFIAVLLGQIIHLVFILLGLLVSLMLLDATSLIGTILGAAGVVGLAVGFAVRDTVENYIASILLSLRNPFDVNDYVSISGQKGNVVRLTSRATILISPDANHIRIPNATVYKSVIINYTRLPERRFQFEVKIAQRDMRMLGK